MSCCGCCCCCSCCCCCKHVDRQKLCLQPAQPKCWRSKPASGPMPRKQKSPSAVHPCPAIMMAPPKKGHSRNCSKHVGWLQNCITLPSVNAAFNRDSSFIGISYDLVFMCRFVSEIFERALLLISFRKHIRILRSEMSRLLVPNQCPYG